MAIVFKTLAKAKKIEPPKIKLKEIGKVAPQNNAIGTVKISTKSIHKKFKSHGFWMECLLTSLATIPSKPNNSEAIQAKKYNVIKILYQKYYYIAISFS